MCVEQVNIEPLTAMSRMLFVAVVALVMMASPAIAATDNIKYALECGAAKSTPPDNDYSDPIYKTKIAVTDKVILVWTMVGTIRMDKGDQWVEYIEKLFVGGKLQATTVSVCRPIPGSSSQ
jgi:hypothetical protein